MHQKANCVRGVKIRAFIVIVIGQRPGLRELALAAAKRIGKVEVDHGETSCQVPDAVKFLSR
jgi:hypothetical protein